MRIRAIGSILGAKGEKDKGQGVEEWSDDAREPAKAL